MQTHALHFFHMWMGPRSFDQSIQSDIHWPVQPRLTLVTLSLFIIIIIQKSSPFPPGLNPTQKRGEFNSTYKGGGLNYSIAFSEKGMPPKRSGHGSDWSFRLPLTKATAQKEERFYDIIKDHPWTRAYIGVKIGNGRGQEFISHCIILRQKSIGYWTISLNSLCTTSRYLYAC